MGDVEPVDVGGEGDDVAALYACESGTVETFGRQDADRAAAEPFFLRGDGPDERGVALQGRIAMGMPAHEVELQRVVDPSQGGGHFFDVSSPLVVDNPVAEIVQPGGVTVDAPVAVAQGGEFAAEGFPGALPFCRRAGQGEHGLHEDGAIGLLQVCL